MKRLFAPRELRREADRSPRRSAKPWAAALFLAAVIVGSWLIVIGTAKLLIALAG